MISRIGREGLGKQVSNWIVKMKKVIFIISIFSALFSQANQEFILKDVKVEGNIVSTENTIIFTSGLRKGLKVSSSGVARATER